MLVVQFTWIFVKLLTLCLMASSCTNFGKLALLDRCGVGFVIICNIASTMFPSMVWAPQHFPFFLVFHRAAFSDLFFSSSISMTYQTESLTQLLLCLQMTPNCFGVSQALMTASSCKKILLLLKDGVMSGI